MTITSLATANPIQLEYTKAELLSEVKAITPGKPFWVVLKLTMRSGWHTYWQNPGDSGMATSIEWQLPDGFKASAIQWLPPERINTSVLTNFGYNNESFHLVEITPPKDLSAQPQTLVAKASWLVCEDICIPESTDLTLTIPVGTETNQVEYSEHQSLFTQLRSELPKIIDAQASYVLNNDKIIVKIPISILGDIKIADLEFYPVNKGIIKNPAPQPWTVKNDFIEITLTKGSVSVEGPQPTLIKISGKNPKSIHAFQLDILPTTTEPKNTTNPTEHIWQILLFAFLGGLILNAMPCVFPILSLKALSIAQHSKGQIRQEGALYTLGVLVSFIVLASILLALKVAGHTIGWGFQMQSPIFIALMTYLMFLIGLSLSGLFYLPILFANTESFNSKHPSSNFWVGVLAVLVATPCTAPFMGVAIGYALTQSAIIILAVFISLGIGFALPYLLISLFPPLLKLLPKPGQWMETLKEFLAFPMYATAVWLLWVLTQQAGTKALLLISMGLVFTTFSIWWWQRLRLENKIAKVIWLIIFSCLSLWPFYYLSDSNAHSKQVIEQFSLAKLNELKNEKKAVFVNATAAWCITCKVNEVILKSDSISEVLKKNNITYLEADWTNQNSEITQYLASFGRSGVPLYVFYPVNGDPVVLPQLLTEGIIKGALTQGGK